MYSCEYLNVDIGCLDVGNARGAYCRYSDDCMQILEAACRLGVI